MHFRRPTSFILILSLAVDLLQAPAVFAYLTPPLPILQSRRFQMEALAVHLLNARQARPGPVRYYTSQLLAGFQNKRTQVLMPAEEKHTLPLYLWTPFITSLRAMIGQGISADEFLFVEKNGMASIDQEGRIQIVQGVALEVLATVLSKNLGRSVVSRDVETYLRYHEEAHQRLKANPDFVDGLLFRLRDPSLYQPGDLIDGFQKLREYFANNYGGRFLNNRRLVVELYAVYRTEEHFRHGPVRVVPDSSKPRERIEIPGPVRGVLRDLSRLEDAYTLAKQTYSPEDYAFCALVTRKMEEWARLLDVRLDVDALAASMLHLVPQYKSSIVSRFFSKRISGRSGPLEKIAVQESLANMVRVSGFAYEPPPKLAEDSRDIANYIEMLEKLARPDSLLFSAAVRVVRIKTLIERRAILEQELRTETSDKKRTDRESHLKTLEKKIEHYDQEIERIWIPIFSDLHCDGVAQELDEERIELIRPQEVSEM